MSQSEQILASQEGVCSVELVNPDAKRPSGDLGVRNVINVCVCVCVYMCGIKSCGSGQGPVAGCCEHCNEPPGNSLASWVTVRLQQEICSV